jgi:hypothetical protein
MSTDGPTIPTIRTDRGEWLRWDLARSLATEVSDIREELAALQERFVRVMDDVRRLPGGEMAWQCVDAYPGTRLDRDMGAGVDADGWLAEVAEFLEPLTEATLDPGCDGFVGGNAWGPCPECGRRLEDHTA